MIAEAVVLLGAILIALAAVGVVRFDDTLARTHALTKATVAGIVLMLLGAAVHLSDPDNSLALTLTAVLQALTTPVAGHLLGRAVYRSGRSRLDVVDELGDAETDSQSHRQ